MNIYIIAFVLPLIICVTKTSVVIDGEMSFNVQILVDKNGKYVKRQVLETGEEKRKTEEIDRQSARKRKLVKGIYEVDQLESSNKLKAEDNKQMLEERRNDKDKQIYILNDAKVVDGEKHIAEENKTDGKSQIDQKELSKKMITRAVQLECVYQYPERRQMEVLLSDMMNQLTRLIVSVHEYSESDVGNMGNMGDVGDVGNMGDVGDEGNMGDVGDMGKMGEVGDVGNMGDVGDEGNMGDVGDMGKMGEVGDVGNMGDVGDVGNMDDVGHTDDANDTRRVPEKRFRVVNDRGPAVFEAIFKNLTHEYQNIYNTTLQNINRSQDPCEHQTEVRKTWQDLLAQAQHVLQRSTLTAVELIVPRNRADDSKHEEMRRMLGEELAKMRSEQLGSLCDNFQLCYNDLL